MKKYFPAAAVFTIMLVCSGCGSGSYGGTALYPPAVPTGLSVKEINESSVTIRWSDNADNESGYNIERSVNGGEFVFLYSGGAGETEFTEDLPDDVYYAYRIYACNSAGSSETTGEISVKRPKTARADITVERGGELTLPNLAVITFPAESFSSDETIAAVEGVMEGSIAEDRHPYLDKFSDVKPVNIIDFTSNGPALKKNVSLVMYYDPALIAGINDNIKKNSEELVYRRLVTRANADRMKINAADLDIYIFNTVRGRWVKTNALIDTELHSFTLEAPYLGIYCIGYPLSKKTGFSIEDNPGLLNKASGIVNDQAGKPSGKSFETSESSEGCPGSCGGRKNAAIDLFDVPKWYKDSCTRTTPLIIDGFEVTEIPGTDKKVKCDNCTGPGYFLDEKSGWAFTGACANHDACYRYGFTTYNMIGLICDIALLTEMNIGCADKYPLVEKFKIVMPWGSFHIYVPNMLNFVRLPCCLTLAYYTYAGVTAAEVVTRFNGTIVPYDKQPCFDYYNTPIDCKVPRITGIESGKSYCEPGETIDLTSIVYNPEHRAIAYSWNSSAGSVNNSAAGNMQWTAPSYVSDDSEAVISLAITDGINTITPGLKNITVLKPYAITYNANGATAGTVPASSFHNYCGNAYYAESNSGNLKRDGYYFAGWNTNPDGKGLDRPEYGFFFMEKGDMTFYAKWLPVYTVKYDGGGNTGGTVPVDSNSYKPGANVAVQRGTEIEKTGFCFAGWNTMADGSGTDIGNYFRIENSDVIFYARWIPAFAVTYNGNGNTGGTVPVDAERYVAGSAVRAAVNTGVLVNSGRHFTGWNTSADGSGDDRGAGGTFTMGSSDIILYAKWSSSPVTYNGNGSTGGVVPVDPAYYSQGDIVTVKSNTGNLVRSGYTFCGWNTSAGGDGTDYSSGAVFRLSGAAVTLYAKWSAGRYTVTFHTKGGSAVEAQTADHGSRIVFPVSKMGGFDLNGWTADGTTLWNFDTNPVTGNLVLSALWVRHIYQLRERGPAGGLIFYDKGSEKGGWRYLEAAPYDQGETVWTAGSTVNTGATGTAIGSGRINTPVIEYYQGAGNYAAKLCDELVIVNDGIAYSDWFLPSSEELSRIGWNLCGVKYNIQNGGTVINGEVPTGGIGDFHHDGDGTSGGGTYWSSSENSINNAYHQNLWSGAAGNSGKKTVYRVRAVHAF